MVIYSQSHFNMYWRKVAHACKNKQFVYIFQGILKGSAFLLCKDQCHIHKRKDLHDIFLKVI